MTLCVIWHYGISLLTPINFYAPTVNFGPLMATYFSANGVSKIYKQTNKFYAWLSWYLTFTLVGGVAWPLFVFTFQPQFQPSSGIFCLQMGFPELTVKILAQFLSYLVFTLKILSLRTPINFHVLTVYSTIWRPTNFLLSVNHGLGNRTILDVGNRTTLDHLVEYVWIRPVVIRAGVYYSHLRPGLFCYPIYMLLYIVYMHLYV